MKRILVTGTSAGIGRATVSHLVAKGFFVYANVRSEEHLDIWKDTENVEPVLFDVRDRESIARGVEQISADGAELYGLVNNAGISNWGPILDIPDDIFKDILETNLLGPIKVTKAFLPLLSGEAARIINISSISGKLIFPFMGPYHVAKAGLEAFSDTLRRELLIIGEGQTRVVIIEPGSVATRLWDRAEKTTVFTEDSKFYETALTVGRKVIEQEKAGAFSPELVARAIHKALVKRKPKLRYVVSPQSMTYKMLLRLSDSWLDRVSLWVFRRLAKKK